MTRVIAFDVNESLLDLAALDEAFDALLGSAALRDEWFRQMLQITFVGGLTGEYVDYSTAQHAALLMLAERHGRTVSPADAAAIVERMSSLPAHPEVPGALRRLRTTSLKTAALTNSVGPVAEAQLANSGLRGYFDAVISADSVKRLKPLPDPYLAAAKTFGVDVSEVRLVAAHWWDVGGAMAAGCRAAFIARPGMVLSPIGRRPDIVGADLSAVVDQIMVVDTV
ncbi:haloacid dehalogenase [Microtetraspora sp. NBRC 13810]|uniref:haloacid dehalogenase type II n=1 Tax=Microtetraspora sp. NBRC 13810 TaxID=3030990 RepID=UPI0024A4E483|nr:haloacid dehalogenase type II [Microtetraspora sp. NBRC 13810]GLW09090.1 haloacid dehalogenase [Microtetraspora sp. NBRC 13810]